MAAVEKMASREKMARAARKDRSVLSDSKDHQDRTVYLEHLEKQESKEASATQEKMVILVRMEHLAQLDYRETWLHVVRRV